MVVGVISDLVAFRHDPPNESRIIFGVYTDEKERGFHFRCFQNVENLRCPFRIRPVVKCDRDLMRTAGALMIKGRELRKF